MTPEAVLVLEAPLVDDEYGTPNSKRDWPNATSTEVLGLVAPRSSSERSDVDRAAVIVGLTAYLPAGTAVTAHSRLVVRGTTYEVDGEPGDWSGPDASWAGLEVALRRVVG